MDRRGSGPGEFETITAAMLHPAGDTLVFGSPARVSYFTPDFRFVRSFNVPIPVRRGAMVGLPNGDIIVTSAVQDSTGSVRLLHRFSADGNLESSFAAIPSTSDLPEFMGSATPGYGWLLSATGEGLVAERWNLQSEVTDKRVVLNPQWWRSSDIDVIELEMEAVSGIMRTPPDSRPLRLSEAGGLLWIGVAHADPNWFDRGRDKNDPGELWDGVLLALDLETGEPLSSFTFPDGKLNGFTPRGELVVYSLDSHGFPKLQFYDVSVTRAR